MDTLTDWRFLAMAVLIFMGATWIISRRDPLFWMIRILIGVRAAIALLIQIVVEGAGEFRNRLPGKIESTKAEVSA